VRSSGIGGNDTIETLLLARSIAMRSDFIAARNGDSCTLLIAGAQESDRRPKIHPRNANPTTSPRKNHRAHKGGSASAMSACVSSRPSTGALTWSMQPSPKSMLAFGRDWRNAACRTSVDNERGKRAPASRWNPLSDTGRHWEHF
jgi:hypothetical protein